MKSIPSELESVHRFCFLCSKFAQSSGVLKSWVPASVPSCLPLLAAMGKSAGGGGKKQKKKDRDSEKKKTKVNSKKEKGSKKAKKKSSSSESSSSENSSSSLSTDKAAALAIGAAFGLRLAFTDLTRICCLWTFI